MLYTFVLVVVLLVSTQALEHCISPNGERGECVPLQNCTFLYSYLSKGSLSPRTTFYLRRSQCGFLDKNPKVCCPIQETQSFIATSDLLPDIDSCGLHTGEKIVAGEKADIDEYPWMAILQFQAKDGSKSFECGGTLINNRYVLTAAHCISSSLIGVRLGEYNIDTDPDCIITSFGKDCAPRVQDYKIAEKIIHDSYDEKDTKHYHDIGLIRLDREVEFSDFIQPICLPLTTDEINKNYVGQKLTVAGWGQTEFGNKSSIKLKAQLPVQDLDFCEYKYKKVNSRFGLDVGQLCAGGVTKRDACRGDSGGPLMDLKTNKKREPRFYVVGIVSYGPSPCGQETLPGVYTKVSQYITWIVNSLKP